MEPNVQPLKPPVALPTSSFRDRLLAGKVKRVTDNAATLHLPLEVSECSNYFVIRIPRNLDYADLRTKDAFIDDAGRTHKESAMLTINTVAVKDADYTATFTHGVAGKRLEMPIRPNVTLNVNCTYGSLRMFDSESGEELSVEV